MRIYKLWSTRKELSHVITLTMFIGSLFFVSNIALNPSGNYDKIHISDMRKLFNFSLFMKQSMTKYCTMFGPPEFRLVSCISICVVLILSDSSRLGLGDGKG